MRVFVLTCNKYMWALKPFSYLFNKYWGETEVVYGAFKKPELELPDNFTYFEVDTHDYPKDKWSNALIRMLDRSPDEHIIFLLEDYWLTRKIDVAGIRALFEWTQSKPSVLRFDLTMDRAHNGHSIDVGYIDHFDVIATPPESEYQFSTQAGIWNTKLLRELLKENKTAWETEIHTSPPDNMKVYGTKQNPVPYANALLKGEIDESQLDKLRPDDREKAEKWIPKSYQ